MNYYFDGDFTVAAGATLNVLPGVRAEISYGNVLRVNGTASLQSGSSLNFGGIGGITGRQMIVSGTLRTDGATLNGSKVLQLNDSAIVDWNDTAFNVAIATGPQHIDKFSAAGGGKDNRSFRDIYINGATWSTGTLSLRTMGTQTQANLRYLFDGDFIVAPGATLNLLPSARAEIGYGFVLRVNGTANFQSSRLIFQGIGGITGRQMFVNGTMITNTAYFGGTKFLQLNDSANIDFNDSSFDIGIATPAKHIAKFSAATGGKDNRYFSAININSETWNQGLLNLRSIGTTTTANLNYYFDGDFVVAAGSSLTLDTNARATINYGFTLTVNGTANLLSGSLLTFAGISGVTGRQMYVNGTLRTDGAVFNGDKVLQLNDSAIVDVNDSGFNVAIATPARHIDKLSAAGGGKDNRRFNEIYIRSGTWSTGALNLRQMGTRDTTNLKYFFEGDFTVAAGATLNVLPSVRTEVMYGNIVTINGTANFELDSSINFAGGSGALARQMIVNGTLRTDGATFFGDRVLQLNNAAIVDFANTGFNTTIVTPAIHIDKFSAAGGGKDNRFFTDIYINAGTLSSGSLDLRSIGTQSTANLNYYFDGAYNVMSGATLNLMPNVRAQINYNMVVTVNGSANLYANSTLTFGGSGTLNSSQLIINGSLVSTDATITGVSPRALTVNASASAQFNNTAVTNVLLNFASGATTSVVLDAGLAKTFGSGGISQLLAGVDTLAVRYGSTLAVPQSIEIGGSVGDTPAVNVSYSSTLSLTGSLTAKTQSASTFQAPGRIRFNGSGTIANPQRLEVMGYNLGPSAAGFAPGNFAIGRLELANNTAVQLINASVNRPGPNGEALYVNTLVVPAGTRLDLNGMRVYVRAVQNAGTIVGGSLSVVGDGGPLEFATPTPGTIDSGTTDTWTFTANQSGPVMIQVNPGSTGATAALPTVLNRVRVELLSASDAVLKVVENDANGNLATLLSDPLTNGQNYKIRVRAHSSFSSLAGNYVITLVNSNATETAISITPDPAVSANWKAPQVRRNSSTTSRVLAISRVLPRYRGR